MNRPSQGVVLMVVYLSIYLSITLGNREPVCLLNWAHVQQLGQLCSLAKQVTYTL